MKPLLSSVLILFTLLQLSAQDLPFHRGVNLPEYYMTSSVQKIPFSDRILQDFKDIRSLGGDVVRLPISFSSYTRGAPSYELDPLLLDFLDQSIIWAEEAGIQLILDFHLFNSRIDTIPNEDLGYFLNQLWSQLALRYKDKYPHIYFEIMNEPDQIMINEWSSIARSAIETIRSIDSLRFIILGSIDWSSIEALDKLPYFEDSRLIYTFHFYDPFLFTHQGATWIVPSMLPLKGVPFPADSSHIPETPEELKGTWIDSSLSNYHQQGTIDAMIAQLDKAARFGRERNVPLFCGEFGVYDLQSDPDDRVFWYKTVREALEERNIAWTSWDYRQSFGIFQKDSPGDFQHDLNISIIDALGFNTPMQTARKEEPQREALTLYSDFLSPQVRENSYGQSNRFNYYNTMDPAEGNRSLAWSGAEKYGTLCWTFRQTMDLSYLLAQNYSLQFWVKGDSPGYSFDVRFMNSSEDRNIPWRMVYTLDENLIPWDGQWHQIQIPLKDFQDKGAWKEQWINSRSEFNWQKVVSIEWVAEHQPLGKKILYFDGIKIAAP